MTADEIQVAIVTARLEGYDGMARVALISGGSKFHRSERWVPYRKVAHGRAEVRIIRQDATKIVQSITVGRRVCAITASRYDIDGDEEIVRFTLVTP